MMTLTFFSAALFLIPFLIPQYSPLLFLFAVPIIYEQSYRKLTVKDGALWGLLVFSVHLIWFWALLFEKEISFLRISFSFFTISWFLAWTILFFCSISKLNNLLKNKLLVLCASLTILTAAYVWFIIKGSLFLLGLFEGYVFFNPFVALSYYPQLVWILHYTGVPLALCALIGLQVGLPLGFIYKSKHCYIFAFICMMPFFIGLYFYKPAQEPLIDTSNMVSITPWWLQDRRRDDPMFVGYRIVHDIAHATVDKDKAIVLTPESSFGWNLYDHMLLTKMLCQNNEHTILLGSQRKENDKVYNSCFIIKEGNVLYTYDKQHLVPFVERMPYFFSKLDVFNIKQNHFSLSDKYENDVIYIEGKPYQLFICSELIFEAKKVKGLSIIFVCNDNWFKSDYCKKLLQLFTSYVSSMYKISIIYCTTSGYSNI